MTKTLHEITVHTMSPVHGHGPVFYAFLPHHGKTSTVNATNPEGPRHHLISILWEHVVALDSSLWKSRFPPNSVPFSIRVAHDPLGKPYLLLPECPGPAISFSEGGGAVWAALCGDGSEIGIDVADAGEFRGNYPLRRVFNESELEHVVRSARGDVASGSALLWSIKEAVVKALGCGFHLVEPRDLCVDPSAEEDGGYTFPVRLSPKALERLPRGAGRSIWVRSLQSVKMWLSIALLD